MVWGAGTVVTSLLALERDPNRGRANNNHRPLTSPSFRQNAQSLHGYRPLNDVPSSNDSSSRSSSTQPMQRCQVCCSPACIADGAAKTLEKMQALAPAHVLVEAGSCTSLCGSGPVVVVSSGDDDGGVKEKRVQQDERILELLYPAELDLPHDLMQGYDLVRQGDEAFVQEQYAQALGLYDRAVTVAFRSAVELENKRDALFVKWKNEQNEESSASNKNGDSSDSPGASKKKKNRRSTTRVPEGLQWLIRARRNEATCKLKMNDLDGAMLAAQASCNLSRNTSGESFLLLAEIYRLEGGLDGEAQALETAISLWSDDDSLTFAQKNRKRIATIRLQKVQREISLAKPEVPPEDVLSIQEKPVGYVSKNFAKKEANGKSEPSSTEEEDDDDEPVLSLDKTSLQNITLADSASDGVTQS